MVIKNLENKIKLVSIICFLVVIASVVISIGSLLIAGKMVTDAHEKIYVLDGNVPILVSRTTMDETSEIEAKSHIEMFHHLFFTLAPDDRYIQYTLEKAQYLADESAAAQEQTLKEHGFYNNIISTSSLFAIFCDSINYNKQDMTFTYYGRQRIERRTSILFRSLVTSGKLKKVPRSDNNPHGFLITDWRTILNKDLEENAKTFY